MTELGIDFWKPLKRVQTAAVAFVQLWLCEFQVFPKFHDTLGDPSLRGACLHVFDERGENVRRKDGVVISASRVTPP